jgi:hypothetical protein
MGKWILAAGAAALALSAPVVADPGHGKGGQKAEQKNRGAAQKDAQKARGPAAKGDHSRSTQQVRVDRPGKGRAMQSEHRVAKVQREDRQIRVRDKDVRKVVVRDLDDDRFNPRFGQRGLASGLIDGCPPGLAAKHNGCLPPGQAKKLVGSALPTALTRSVLSGPYRDWYRDDDRFLYRMSDDYIYRVDRGSGLINALIPYVDRDFSYYPVGAMYPSDFNYYNVPYQYQGYYPDGGQYAYRYGDGAIYSLDPQTQAIQSIVALLAGDLSVGQRLPMGYSTYNVPLSYRDRYYDSADNLYRYNDGYIYRVDPTTQLITAVINALV